MKTAAAFISMSLALCCVSAALAVPSYSIVPMGLLDLEHTDNNGYRFSLAEELNEAGQVSGYSERYNGGSTNLGRSAWLYDGAATINIGLTGSEHTSGIGRKYSYPEALNETGQVIGGSYRYNGGVPYLGASAWLYNGAATIDVGLAGSEHTRDDGYRNNVLSRLNEAGQVTGDSERYNGGSSFQGRSAWLYDGAATINIGLTDSEHTRVGGFKYSLPTGLNEAGQVSGYSDRYNGGSIAMGRSAWLFDGATTINIGLTGIEHTRVGGFKYSFPTELNEAGQVSGYSDRYNGGSIAMGRSAWLYDGAATIEIGLVGSEHTSPGGYRFSESSALNEAGQVTGYATRNASGSSGYSVWLYDGATTIHIGLTGSEHTRNGGYKESFPYELNEAGQVSGYAGRFNGESDGGQSSWLYDGAATIDIGLVGGEHTRNDGYKASVSTELNESGQVRGYSYRYNGGSSELGRSAWLYNGEATIDVGLGGSEHTRDDGYRYSEAVGMNESGQVRGYSERYNGGGTELGRSAWLYDGAATINIGLTGSEHTRNDDYKYSEATGLNSAGQVRGYSQRFDGGQYLGQDAWLYDPVLNQTFVLQLSISGFGSAFSSADYLGDDGLVLGTYNLFDPLDDNLGDRAFYFTIADGLHDLGSLVDGGLAANGWDSLADIIRANGLGQILGHGKLTSQMQSQLPYLLTPVPEPSALCLAVLGAIAMLARRRR